MRQLRMVFNAETTAVPEIVPPAGYRIRSVLDKEWEKYSALRVSADFGYWSREDLKAAENNILTNALLVLERVSDGFFCASATAEKHSIPDFGVLGWVMVRPDFRGRHFGQLISGAAMRILYCAGYRMFTLLTDDFRLPAVKTYLKMGWRPWLDDETMEERWRKLCIKLEFDYGTLEKYPEKFFISPRLSADSGCQFNYREFLQ